MKSSIDKSKMNTILGNLTVSGVPRPFGGMGSFFLFEATKKQILWYNKVLSAFIFEDIKKMK